MAIESVGFISDLNTLWPIQEDTPVEGAGHDRVTKLAVKNSFPNIDGEVTLTAEEMNGLIQGVEDAVKKAGDAMSGDLLMTNYKALRFALTEDGDVFGRVRGVDDRIDIEILDSDGLILNTISINATTIAFSSVATGITPDGSNQNEIVNVDYVANNVSILRDVKNIGIHGGTFTSGDWVVRDINDVLIDEIGASIAANQITLPEGKYQIDATAPAHGAGSSILAWRKVSTGNVVRGQNVRSTGDDDTTAFMNTKQYVTADDVTNGDNIFELVHQCETTNIDDGLGYASGLMAEVYAQVTITKVL